MMNSKLSGKKSYFIVGLTLTIFLLSLFQFISQKPMVLDGSRFLLAMLTGDLVPYDGWHRYSTLIWQILAGILGYPFEGQLRHEILVTLYNFFYSFHALISIGICFFVLPKSKQNHIIFPILSYLLATLPVMSFPGSHVVELTSYLWPFLFILQYGKNHLRSLLVFFIFGLLIIFSYMQSMALLYLIAFYYLVFKKQKSSKVKVLFLLVGIGTAFYIYKWFGFIEPGKKNQLINQLIYIYYGHLYIIFLPSLIFLFQFYINLYKNLKQYNILFLIPYSLIAYLYINYINPMVYMGFYLRLLNVPILIAVVLVFLYWTRKGEVNLNKKGFMLFVLIPLLVNAHFDYTTSKKVKRGFGNIESFLQKSKGCTYIGKQVYDDKIGRFGLSPDFLLLHSIILGGYEVDTILYSTPNGYWGKKDFAQINTCKSILGKSLPIYIYEDISFEVAIWENKYLEFGNLEASLRSARKIIYKDKTFDELKYIAFKSYENSAKLIVKDNINILKLKYYSNVTPKNITISSEDNIKKYKSQICDKSTICFSTVSAGTYKIQVDLDEGQYIMLSEYYSE